MSDLASTSAFGSLHLKDPIEGHGLSLTVIIWMPVESFKQALAIKAPQQQSNDNGHQLHLWRDGFSINAGPLLSYANDQELLNKLYSGVVPAELFGLQPGDLVSLEFRSHKDRDYVAPALRERRIPGFIDKVEKEYVQLFGVTNVDPDIIVQVRPVDAAQVTSHRGLLVQYTSIFQAAQAVDKMREPAPNYIFEFVRDPPAPAALEFKGPFDAPVLLPGNLLPKPDRLKGVNIKNAQPALKPYRNLPIYWDLVEVAINQEAMAKTEAQATGKKQQNGDWVCLKCSQFTYRGCDNCYNEQCKASRLETIFESVGFDLDQEQAVEPLLHQANVAFVQAPAKITAEAANHQVQNLPLISLFT